MYNHGTMSVITIFIHHGICIICHGTSKNIIMVLPCCHFQKTKQNVRFYIFPLSTLIKKKVLMYSNGNVTLISIIWF